VEPRELLFTSGGTEADNMAVLGAALRGLFGPTRQAHVVTSPTEHKAVLAAAHEAERYGAHLTLLPVDRDGVVDPDALDDALAGRSPAGRPTVVSVMWVNNETGVVQPVADLAQRCRTAGVPFHTDAVQAIGKLALDLGAVPATWVTISAHKIGGPKGVGALVVRDREHLEGRVHGGGQQGGLRPGTENIAGAIGLGVAAELAASEQAATAEALRTIRDALEQALRAALPDLVVHGAGAERSPAILHVSAPGTDSESMLMHLDLAGIACASGSACTTGSVAPSHVLQAMGVPRDVAVAAVRMSVGSLSRIEQVPRVAEAFASCVSQVRQLRAALGHG
jgi:cysteine desulfurase